MKKFLLRAFLICLALFIGLILFLRFWNFDIPEQDFSDMMPTRRNIPQETNAFYVYREAYSKITDVDRLKELAEQENPDDKEVEEFLKENEEALALIDKGLEMDFEEPDVVNILQDHDYVLEWLSLSKLSSLRMINDELKFTKQILKNNKSILSLLIAQNSYQKILKEELNSESSSLALLGDEVLYNAYKETMKSELLLAFSLLDQVHNSSVEQLQDITSYVPDGKTEGMRIKDTGSYIFQINASKRMCADIFHQGISHIDKKFDYVKYLQQMQRRHDWLDMAKGNAIGKILNIMTLPNLTKPFVRTKYLVLLEESIKVKKAISEFQIERQERPNSLEELVPQYLKRVPVDPYDLQPLRYDSIKGLVYSVGQNLIDNGGKLTEYNDSPWSNGNGDLVVNLHLPEVPKGDD